MNKLKVLDLFSGIGGFSLGLERTGGFETVAFCEIEPFPRKVLAKHWPKVPCYEDVTKLTGQQLAADGIAVDVITGGFPCQDISVAGKQAGIGEGTRSGLWSECLRLVSELRPRYAIFENVSNLLSGPSGQPGAWFSRILADLAGVGYNAEWENIPARAVGAPHNRQRVWIIAYTEQTGRRNSSISHKARDWFSRTYSNDVVSPWTSSNTWKKRTEGVKPQTVSGFSAFSWRQDVRRIEDYFGGLNIPEPLVRRYSDGFPNGLDRVGACGNAVVPQIPELIGHAILEAERAA